MKKYELTSETKVIDGVELHRIKALESFGDVEKGNLGGWIKSEKNLSQYGDAWVYDNAIVSDNAIVNGNAKVCGNARIFGNAWVGGHATVFGNATVEDNAEVYGNATISGDAKVRGKADYIVFKNWWSSGRYFTWTRSNNKWKVGCFYGSGEELIAKAYEDNEKSGREYERIVNYVEYILKEEDNGNRNKCED